jgi:hypothetical protein
MRSKTRRDVTVWRAGNEDSYGDPTFASPELIGGHWEERSELTRTAQNEEIVSKAVVFVDTEVAVGDYLGEGDQTGISTPDLAQASEVRDFRRIPSMRTNQTELKAIL